MQHGRFKTHNVFLLKIVAKILSNNRQTNAINRWILTPTTFFALAVLGVSTATAATVVANPLDSRIIGQSTPSSSPAPTQFRDVANDIYAAEIEKAVELGVIAGFPEDNRFRPQESMTREQMVSMIVESLKKVPLENTNRPFSSPNQSRLPDIPEKVSSNPFPDVDKSRWSAAKIQFARSLGVIQGYRDGTFRPTKRVTRAELVVALQQADQYINKLRGWNGREFFEGEKPLTFSDIENHWASKVITGMSANCRVAAPINEKGSTFAPDAVARRNYAAAAVVRFIRCSSIFPPPPS